MDDGRQKERQCTQYVAMTQILANERQRSEEKERESDSEKFEREKKFYSTGANHANLNTANIRFMRVRVFIGTSAFPQKVIVAYRMRYHELKKQHKMFPIE